MASCTVLWRSRIYTTAAVKRLISKPNSACRTDLRPTLQFKPKHLHSLLACVGKDTSQIRSGVCIAPLATGLGINLHFFACWRVDFTSSYIKGTISLDGRRIRRHATTTHTERASI